MKSTLLLLSAFVTIGLAAPAARAQATSAQTLPTIRVYHEAHCQCCGRWIDHLRAQGFPVVWDRKQNAARIKRKHRVPRELYACHTAVVDGYAIEGHVPADVILRLLATRPPVAGIAVPGMPVGSPGMEGGRVQSYEIIAFTKDGEQTVYDRR